MSEALRYYCDEHVHAAISSGLQARGIDILTAQAAGRANKRIPDDEQLAYATARGLVTVTNDRDFIRLHREQIPHAGIIMLQQVLTIGEYIDYLELFALTTAPEDIRNTLVFCKW